MTSRRAWSSGPCLAADLSEEKRGQVFGAASNVVYSYAGHWLYFELMVEMEQPEHFPRVFWINVPIQVGPPKKLKLAEA